MPTNTLVLLTFSLSLSCLCAISIPSPECRLAAQTDNVIRCLSRTEHFQDTLAKTDFCEQARLVYTCFNKTCCLENRAYDIERDSNFATCNIDCSYTTPPPTTSSTPDEIYTTTMAPFDTTTPAPSDSSTSRPRPSGGRWESHPEAQDYRPSFTPSTAPWDMPTFQNPWLNEYTPPPGTPSSLTHANEWSWQPPQAMHIHAPALSMYLLAPVAVLVLGVLIASFTHTQRPLRHRHTRRTGSLF